MHRHIALIALLAAAAAATATATDSNASCSLPQATVTTACRRPPQVNMCPTVPGKSPLDMEKLQGDWLLAAANEATLAKKGKCGKLTLPALTKEQIKDDFVLACHYSGVNPKDNSPIELETYSQPKTSSKVGNLVGVNRITGTNIYSPVYEQTLVASDYTTYALLLACKIDFDAEDTAFRSTTHAEIWSRPDAALSEEVMRTLTSLLASYGIEPASIKAVKHDC